MPTALEEKFASIKKYIPKELLNVAQNKNLEDYKYILPRINVGNLPFRFKLNTRGGWVTPDGSWYLESTSADVDCVLRPRLKDSFKFNNNLRLQAFQEGWIRIDWKQPSFGLQFDVSESSSRRLIITVDGSQKISHKLFLAIQTIAMLYTVIQANKIVYELRLVTKYDKNNIIHKAEDCRGFEFFNLKLNKIRR
ncbi:MAG: hypothetical protein IJ184_02905 [Alphaproteobacteria bacterium]|nr:hypothetical protein [Alphaproteobacteria bacterium]